MEEKNNTKTQTKEDENPTKINHHQEEHKEESEWHQKVASMIHDLHLQCTIKPSNIIS